MASIKLLFIILGLVALASARTVQWTGAAGNSLWSFSQNWEGNAVPTKDDDVIINAIGGANVQINLPATARTLSVGGGTYAQGVILYSSLQILVSVTVGAKGTLLLQGNNELPLSSAGPITVQSGGTINFSSGDIKGPGVITIEVGATIDFTGNALKKLEATDLIIRGVAVIQPSTIQLAAGATITNNGVLTAVGLITIYSDDNSKASFTSYGNFTYQGTSTNSPLTFQVATYISGPFNVAGGSVVFNAYFYGLNVINLPLGTVLNIGASADTKTFTNIIGAGALIVSGTVEIKGTLDVSWVTLTDSGLLTLSGNATTRTTSKSLTAGGKLVLGASLIYSVTDASLIAGTVTGAGTLVVAGNFEIAVSPTGNQNSFIQAKVEVHGNGYVTGAAYILFADGGNLIIFKGATFKISGTAHFGKQSGNPLFTNNGEVTLALVSGSFESNVDVVGGGNFDLSSGRAMFESDHFEANILTVGDAAVLSFDNTIIKVNSVSGRGSLNATTGPSTASSFGDVALSYFGVPNGNVTVKSLAVTTFEFWSGVVTVGTGSVNKATVFNFYGGTLEAAFVGTGATFTLTTFKVGGPIPQVVDGIAITTSQFLLTSPPTSGNTLITQHGSRITAPEK